MKRIYGSIAVLLAAITVVSLCLTAMIGVRIPSDDTTLSVVASIFPMYTATLQVVGSCEGVSVTCLTAPTAGCAHDYQLSPSEMAVLSSADVLVMNGAGAESFLEAALENIPSVKTVDTSVGIAALTGDAHDHDHDINEHLWVDPARYARQVCQLRDGLCEADPAHAAEYTRNAEAYLQEIQEIQQALAAIPSVFTHAVLFHDSMAYAADALQLEAVGVVPLGENRAASAAELTAIAEALDGKAALFLYDDQYEPLHTELTAYADRAAVVKWNTAAQPIDGVAACDTWLHAMRQTVQALKEASA